jgi:hypothetical protein
MQLFGPEAGVEKAPIARGPGKMKRWMEGRVGKDLLLRSFASLQPYGRYPSIVSLTVRIHKLSAFYGAAGCVPIRLGDALRV